MISFRLSEHNSPSSLPRIPLPLPYLPSDYQPSPSSPKHIVISPSQSSSSSSSNLATKQHFELVPYREWTVILRNETSGNTVLYNQESQQISVQRYIPVQNQDTLPSAPQIHHPDENSVECPLCHRPYPKNIPIPPTYMDRNYFRLLSSTPTDSPITSNDNTPRTTSGSQQPMDELFVETSSSSSSTLHLNANAINQGYYSKFFLELRKLGRGFRGSVYLCEHILDGVKLGKYAVKKVAIGNNHTWLVKMLREVHLLERLHHPNIVSYKHSWLEYDRLTPFGPKVPCLFILMECANGGNLEEYLEPEISPQDHPTTDKKKTPKELKRERIKRQLRQQDQYEAETQHKQPIQTQKRLLSMNEISSLFLDIVQGLAHLHQQNIVHRDLKPPNLLLKWDERRRGSEVFKIPRVLISDFGECEDLESVPDSDRTGATGTMEFMAPEHVRLDPRGKNLVDYSPKADMWSLGMVLYYLCYSKLPYSNVDDVDLLREEILLFKEIKFPKSRLDIFQGTVDSSTAAMMETMKRQHATDIPQEFKILIRLLLSTDPAKRPSCQEILSKLDLVKFDHQKPQQDISSNDWTPGEPSASSSASSSSSSMETHVLEDEDRMDDTNKRRTSGQTTGNQSSSLRKRQKRNNDDSLLLLDSPLHTRLVNNEQFYLRMLKTTTAVFKIATCTYPCQPYSTRPILLYPVILLATFDFWSEKISHSLLLLVIHLTWLITMALLTGGMCMS
ncbi:kinase-like domain-containing protein [Halteromyces radiatus]|uniref:kinase-like domain-containing protein n=1 Tax=Halteromyces radiatus TaxID=101107 RepID=UPI00221EEF65|nr:kinase-like domain-containing protein [Halteromyces radiatus]KAI8097743.1 kinase-like domain-containing protein [Halteromyces radiatus]